MVLRRVTIPGDGSTRVKHSYHMERVTKSESDIGNGTEESDHSRWQMEIDKISRRKERSVGHTSKSLDGHYKKDIGLDLKIACPIFKGKKHDDPDVHIQAFELYAELKHILEEEWGEYFPHTLKEGARKWYYHYPTSKLQAYRKLKKAFILEYTDDRGDEDILCELDRIKQGKLSTKKYVQKIKQLTRRLNEPPSEKRMRAWFLNSFNTRKLREPEVPTPTKKVHRTGAQGTEVPAGKKVRCANNASYPIRGVGKILITILDGSNLCLPDVLYVPEIKKNLLSVSSLAKNGLQVIFEDDRCVVRDQENSNSLITIGTLENGLFVLDHYEKQIQAKYLHKILDKFGMQNCKPISTPVEIGSKLSMHDAGEPFDVHTYTAAVGYLIYLVGNTRQTFNLEFHKQANLCTAQRQRGEVVGEGAHKGIVGNVKVLEATKISELRGEPVGELGASKGEMAKGNRGKVAREWKEEVQGKGGYKQSMSDTSGRVLQGLTEL
ncbi:hypothetical protein L7F22_048142 [Adiantum nelumboides]|nr:hypothetical protein [Adiantum nelumboides]